MKSRRLLIVTNRVPYPLHDGGALAMDAMIRGYHEQGMQVRVLAMNTARHFVPQETVATRYPAIAGFVAVPFDNTLRAAHLAKNLLLSTEPEHAQRFYNKDFEAKLLQTISAFQPDVIQIESLFLSNYLPAIKRISKAMLVLRMHNIEYEIWGRLAQETKGIKGQYLQILAKRMRRFEERIWRDYDLLLAITPIDAAAVQQLDKKLPVIIAPFGIDLETKPPIITGNFTATYHIGAMDWLPNTTAIDWLLQDIWPKIKIQVPTATFHFAGRHMAARFQDNLPDGVRCYGEIPDVRAFYANEHVLLVPLRAGGGIRVKILEAMVAGKLVISTDIGMQGIDAIPDIHYLKANTPDEFATALRWCNDYPEQALDLILNARKMVTATYDLAVITKRILERFV